ncbi:D-aminopeptidase [Kribbella voronezhensis]|uniref:D-aminopeptidase n=1 Tax=Kribbella voronezhensis TaxID=2512212 RepID=A0A4R7THW6_9ACTN|nr:P1 family peptidase [Kribbella voronezhensis]TDU91900.1 D-aminopeptidase [Kribbella voronezhensis]
MPTRVRSLGIVPGSLETGPLNAITDVAGVLVGHTTIDDGADLHTGVTAIVPPGFGGGTAGSRGGSAALGALPAAIAVGNGYGKLVGSTQVDELGVLETPILLTGTLSVFRVADALVSWLLERDPEATSLNPVVGETNDGFLSDIRRRPITASHVFAALDNASADLPAEGCVGAGTGTAALGFKAGIGTSSRSVGDGTVGVLVQSNFSGTLTVLGTPVPAAKAVGTPGGNSCMIVVATDLALDARQLGRVARRAVFAMGRVGSDYAPGSGDYAIAFSTAAQRSGSFAETGLREVFQATMEATEEALLNSLTMAHTVTGFRGNTRYAVPLDLVKLASG